MIDENTVFILGAGASMPYGYPSGSRLREIILSKLGSSNVIRDMVSLGFTEEKIAEFRKGLRYSATSSVDSFLEHRPEPEFMDIGKIAMAQVLIPNENQNSLFRNENDKWYTYLFNNLVTDSFNAFDKNKICFITFNYDRSLEQFLFIALKNRYGKSEDECASKLKNIPILHLHGKLNDLPWQNKDGRPYTNQISSNEVIEKAANEIKIIHEDIKDNSLFKEAHGYIENAQNIYFLGFGYHKANMDRLKLNKFVENNIFKNKGVIGSSFGLKGAERQFINNKYFKKEILCRSGYANLGFLEEYFKF